MSPHALRFRDRVPKSLVILVAHRWLSLGHHGGVPPSQALLRHWAHRGPDHSPPSMIYILCSHRQHQPQRAQPVDPIVGLGVLGARPLGSLARLEPGGFRRVAGRWLVELVARAARVGIRRAEGGGAGGGRWQCRGGDIEAKDVEGENVEGGENVPRGPPSAHLHWRTGSGGSDPAHLHGRTGSVERRRIIVVVGRQRERRGGDEDVRVRSDAATEASFFGGGVLRVAARLNRRTGGGKPPGAE